MSRYAARAYRCPPALPSREIIGPAGRDMTIFPPTVDSFQILNEARNARQHSRKSGAAFHSGGAVKRSISATLQVAAISSPSGRMVSEGHWNDSRSISVCVAIWGSENNQVPPASQAYPLGHSLTASAAGGPQDFGDGVQVHQEGRLNFVGGDLRPGFFGRRGDSIVAVKLYLPYN